jgi:hypothetical protein
MSTLHQIIYENVREGELYEKLDRNWVRCFACGHCCKIPDGQPGVCKVRYNGAEPCLCPGAMSAASLCAAHPIGFACAELLTSHVMSWLLGRRHMWRAFCTECAASCSLPFATVYSLRSLFEKMGTSVHRLLSLLRFQNPLCQRATSTLSGPTRRDSKERIT